MGFKLMRALCLFVVFSILSSSMIVFESEDVMAESINGFGYKLINNGTEIEITKYTGSSTDVIIPSTINGIIVTSIASSAFKDKSIRSVTIPDCVTSIGSSAFYHCTALTSISLPKNITNIPPWMFGECTALESIVIPDNVTTIGDYAFYKCGSIENVKFPSKIVSIGMDSFDTCTSLKIIDIPDSVNSIGSSAFAWCTSATTLSLSQNIHSINNATFINCASLTSVTIPDNVTSIGDEAFQQCFMLTSITIPTTVTSIGAWAFCFCTSLKSMNMSDGIKTIGEDAFYHCDSLSYLNIGPNVTSIGEKAFENCKSLTAIDVDLGNPNYVSVDGILYNKSMTSLIQCPNGKSGKIDVQNGVETIGNYAFGHCNYLTSITIPDSATSLGDYAFYLCENLTDLNLGKGLVSIGYYSLCYCTSLTSIIIPESVSSIDEGAFSECTALKTIVLPEYVGEISNGTFAHCTSLSNIIMPDSITIIGVGSFYDCVNLTSIIIGSGVASIGYGAFKSCSNLTSISFRGLVAPSYVGKYWIDGTSEEILGHSIPGSNFNVTGTRWFGLMMGANIAEDFTYDIINGKATVTGYIGNGGNVSIPSSLCGYPTIVIGEAAFLMNSNITSVVIPNSVMRIDDGAFKNCSVLDLVTIGTGVIFIGNETFSNCSVLISIRFQGLVSPTDVGQNWVNNASTGIMGHAYASSDFPKSGEYYHGLLMSSVIPIAPGAPTGLVSVAGEKAVTLNWTAPNSDGGSPIDYYIIYQNNVALIDHFIGTSATISGLVAGRSYNFTVSAHNLIGNGNKSCLVSSIPYSAAYQPTGLNAIAGNGQVTLNWTAPPFDGGRAIDYYVVYQDGVRIGNSTGTSLMIVGLTNGQSYTFLVSAHNTAGLLSENCTSVTTIPYTVPDQPMGLATIAGDSQVILNWTTPKFDGGRAIDYYVVYQDGNALPGHIDGISTIIADLENGCTYSFTVSAVNYGGEGQRSSEISCTPYSVPNKPTCLTAIAYNASIVLNWTSPVFSGKSIEYYIIYQNGIDIIHTDALTATITGLINGHSYRYVVVGKNSVGLGTPSDSATAVPFTTPDAPKALITTSDDGKIGLRWEAPSFDGGRDIDYYIIYQDGIEIGHTTEMSMMIDHLVNGCSYSFAISAYNLAGIGARSLEIKATPYTLPDIPTDLVAIGGNGMVSLSWVAPITDGGSEIDYYIIFRDGVEIRHAFQTFVDIPGLVNGRSYSFSVSAHNLAGAGHASTNINVIPMTVPDRPTGLVATPSENNISLSWIAPIDNGGAPISNYTIYRGTTAETMTVIHNYIGTSFVDSNVEPGCTYYYCVTSSNIMGPGQMSDVVKVVMPYPNLVPINGRIVDSEGRGLSNIQITLENGTSVKTNENGNFSIMASQGEHILTISGKQIETRTITLEVNGLDDSIGNITADVEKSDDGISYIWVFIGVVILIGVGIIATRCKR